MEKEDSVVEEENWAWYTIGSLKVDKILKSVQDNRIQKVRRKDFGNLLLKKMEEADSVSETVSDTLLYSRSNYSVLLGRVAHIDRIFEDGHGFKSQSLHLEEIAFRNDIRMKNRKLFAASGLALIFKHVVNVGDFVCVFPTETTEMNTYISLNEGHNEPMLVAHLVGNPEAARRRRVSTKLHKACKKYYVRTDVVTTEDSSEVRRFAPIRDPKAEKEHSPFERYAAFSRVQWDLTLPHMLSQSPSPEIEVVSESSSHDISNAPTVPLEDTSAAEPPAKKLKKGPLPSSDFESGISGADCESDTTALIDKVRRSITEASRRLVYNFCFEDDDHELPASDSGYVSVSPTLPDNVSEANDSTMDGARDDERLPKAMKVNMHPLDNDSSMKNVELVLQSDTLWESCRETLEQKVAEVLPETTLGVVILFYRTEYGFLREPPDYLQLSQIYSISEKQIVNNGLHLFYKMSGVSETEDQ